MLLWHEALGGARWRVGQLWTHSGLVMELKWGLCRVTAAPAMQEEGVVAELVTSESNSVGNGADYKADYG